VSSTDANEKCMDEILHLFVFLLFFYMVDRIIIIVRRTNINENNQHNGCRSPTTNNMVSWVFPRHNMLLWSSEVQLHYFVQQPAGQQRCQASDRPVRPTPGGTSEAKDGGKQLAAADGSESEAGDIRRWTWGEEPTDTDDSADGVHPVNCRTDAGALPRLLLHPGLAPSPGLPFHSRSLQMPG